MEVMTSTFSTAGILPLPRPVVEAGWGHCWPELVGLIQFGPVRRIPRDIREDVMGDMEDRGDTRWVSYTELAEARGISRESAIRIARRRKWPKRPFRGNSSPARQRRSR
jgi:hypothetical protein